MLVEREGRIGRDAGGGGQSAGGAQHEVIRLGLQPGAERAGDVKRQPAGGGGGEMVAHRGEDGEAVEQVIAIGPAAGDVQVEIDLGGREVSHGRIRAWW